MAKKRPTYKEARNDIVQEIRDKVSLADLLASYGVELKLIGGEMVGHCPLPDHPRSGGARSSVGSFHVRKDDTYWKCFGCGAHGDAIELAKQMEGLDFEQAVIALADRAGIDTKDFEQAIARREYFKKVDARNQGGSASKKREQKNLARDQRDDMKKGFETIFGKKTERSVSSPAAGPAVREVKSSFISWEDAQKLGWSADVYREKKDDFEKNHATPAAGSEQDGPAAPAPHRDAGPKVRLNVIAKDAGIKAAVLVQAMKEIGEPVKSHATPISQDQASTARTLAKIWQEARTADADAPDEVITARSVETFLSEERADNAPAITDLESAEESSLVEKENPARHFGEQTQLDFGATVDVDHTVDENGLPVVPRKTVVVNLLGGPGCGKSTLAHEVVSELKKHGFTVGFVGEYASELIMQGRGEELKAGGLPIQQEIFAVQYDRVAALEGKVDFIVTESPSILSTFYLNEPQEIAQEFSECVKNDYRLHNNFTCFVKRGEDYTPDGRLQTKSEAEGIDEKIKEWMREERIKGTYRQDAGDLIARNAERYYAKLHGVATVQHPELIEDLKPPAGAWNNLRNDAMDLAEANVRGEAGFRHLPAEDSAARVLSARAAAASAIDSMREAGARPSEARLAISETKAVELASFTRAKEASVGVERLKAAVTQETDRKLVSALDAR